VSYDRSDAERRRAKFRRVQREAGRPLLVGGDDYGRAVGKLRSFRNRGMSVNQISEASGVPRWTLRKMLEGSTASMARRHWLAIAAVRFEPPTGRALVPVAGTVRRIEALNEAGFPLRWIADESGYGNHWLYQQLLSGARGEKGILYANAQKVRELYDRIGEKTPEDLGVPPRIARYSRTWAAKRNAVPRHCWDSDTLDDPKAFPEWTGACGTARGRRIHAREGIPECQACRDRVLDPATGFQSATFRALRLERGWSQPQLGDRIGCARESIAGWENGRTNPRESIVPAILGAFGVERTVLFKEE
jgi:DNA-binding XRE family transcriptional regulator